MKLSLNFSTKKYRSLFLNRLLIAVTIMLILIPFGINAFLFVNNNKAIRNETIKNIQEKSKNRELEEMVRQVDRYISELNISEIRQKSGFYSHAIVLRNLKWLRLLSSLELIIPDDVKLRRISPDLNQDFIADRINIRLEGMSKDFDSVLSFLKKLEESPLFDNVYIMSIKNRLRENSGYEYSFEVLYLQPVE